MLYLVLVVGANAQESQKVFTAEEQAIVDLSNNKWYWMSEKNVERLAELKVNLCMECGCCAHGCPASRPLVQTNKLAKAQVAAWKAAKKAAEDAIKAAEEAKKEAVK